MTIPPRRYTAADANKHELIVDRLSRFMRTFMLTAPELLTALRYGVPSDKWVEQVELARLNCEAYVEYHGADSSDYQE